MISSIATIEMLTDEEMRFWSYIMYEHLIFVLEMLDRRKCPDIYQDVARMRDVWKRMGTDRKEYDGMLFNTTILLDSIIRTLKGKVITRSGVSTYSFRTTLIHMLGETQYVWISLHRDLTRDEEVSFWIRENDEHVLSMVTSSKGETSLTEEMKKVADDMVKREDPSLLIPSNDLSLVYESDTKNSFISSSLSLRMIDHEIRETRYGIRKLGL